MIEVLEVDTGEIALFWDEPQRGADRLARRRFAGALRSDLAQLDDTTFLDKWARWDQS